MIERIKKSVLTKRLHKYQRLGKRILKIEVEGVIKVYSLEFSQFYVCITPGSDSIYLNRIKPDLGPLSMSTSAFSDFIVRTENFEDILKVVEDNLKEVLDGSAIK